ncbi:MAG: SH3 domain-containing protein [Anaerolineae bacterium]
MLSFKVLRFLFVLFVFLLSPFVVRSQDGDDCPALVEEALSLTAAVCNDVGRNQACYGNQMLLAEPRAEVPALAFEQPGDLASISDIDTLHLSPMDLEQHLWGVSLMALQANLPDTLPGQNVIVILFGDVDFQAQQRLELSGAIRAGGAVNLRDAPSTTAAVLASVPGATALRLDGRNAAGDWLHVRLASGEIGWVFAEFVEAEGDSSALTEGSTQQFAANPSGVQLLPAHGDRRRALC